MSYIKAAELAAKKKAGESLNSDFWKPENKGEQMVGTFQAMFSVKSTHNDGYYNQYLFETDDGMVKFSMGGAADKEFAHQLIADELYLIEFDGKQDLGGGKTVNKWNITHIPQEFVRQAAKDE